LLSSLSRELGEGTSQEEGPAPAQYAVAHTVEISGYSHFFGLEALIRPLTGRGQVYEYLRKRPKSHVGMPIAKTAQDEVSF